MSDDTRLRLTIPSNGYPEWECLVKHADQLGAFVTLAGSKGIFPSLYELSESLLPETDLDFPAIQMLLLGLSNVQKSIRQLKIPAEKLLPLVIEALEEQGTDEWKENNLDALKREQSIIVKAINQLDFDHPLWISRKAQELSFQCERQISLTRLVTDIRPVFDDSSEAICQALVKHTLVIYYSEGQAAKHIEFSISSDLVDSLMKDCERAKRKEATIVGETEKLGWRPNT